jgi:hypothetical protein
MLRLKKGSFYVEVIITLFMIGLLATSFLPILPSLIEKTLFLKRYQYLQSISDYCGSYVFRWVNFSKESKRLAFSYYENDSELEFTGEKRINKLLWATPPQLANTVFTDHYKVSITFKDRNTRVDSAGIVVRVWYDDNLDSLLNNGELNISFATIITEKQAQ